MRLHTHLCQVEDEERFSVEAHGLRPVDFLESVGWLSRGCGSPTPCISTRDDIARLGAAGVGVCHLAAADMLLAAGICPVKDYEAAGSAVGLGVDGSSSNDSSNMMEAVRHSLMLQRLQYGASPSRHLDALRWATEGGAKCLGRDDIGRIAPGAQADLALFTLDAPRFSGAHDPLAALVLCGAHRADRVMVNGVWRVIDGAVVGLDLEALLAEHRGGGAQIRLKAGLRPSPMLMRALRVAIASPAAVAILEPSARARYMGADLIRYDLLVQDALRSVVRKVLADAARDGPARRASFQHLVQDPCAGRHAAVLDQAALSRRDGDHPAARVLGSDASAPIISRSASISRAGPSG